MNTIITALVAFCASLITGAVSYFLSRRKNSGEIDTSDAAQLWAENNAMRKDMRDEILRNRAEISALRAEIVNLHTEIDSLRNHVRKQELTV